MQVSAEVNAVENQNIYLSRWNGMFFSMASLLLPLAERQEDTKQGPPLEGKLELITICSHLIRPYFNWVRNLNLSVITHLFSSLNMHRDVLFFFVWSRYRIIAIFMKHFLCALLYICILYLI